MGIGTSLGAFYEDQFHKAAAEWDPDKYDDNEMIVSPKEMDTNKQLDQVQMTELGGIPIADTSGFRPSDAIEDRRHQNKEVRNQEILLDETVNQFFQGKEVYVDKPADNKLSRELGSAVLDKK